MKISVLTINGNFLSPILNEFRLHHNVLLYKHSNDNAYNYQNIRALLDWCDVAFVDFCFYPLPQITQMPIVPCKIVARLHGLEVYTQAKGVDWTKVDAVITSPPQTLRLKEWNIPSVIVTLPIGTDIELFKLMDPKSYGHNLCMVGNILPRKRTYTTIQTLAPLLREDWKLYLHGDSASNWRVQLRREYKENIKELIETLGLKENVIFHERMPATEYADWLGTQNIIISNSTMEGYHKSIFDAMSCGVYPLVNCWLGSGLLYPRNNIFHNQQELLDKIRHWSKAELKQKTRWSHEMRKIVVDGHDERMIAGKIREVIENV